MLIQDAAHEDANVIFGVVLDENLQDQIKVTVIATGFPKDACSTQTRSERQQLKMLSDISSYNHHSKLYVPTRLKNAGNHNQEASKAEEKKEVIAAEPQICTIEKSHNPQANHASLEEATHQPLVDKKEEHTHEGTPKEMAHTRPEDPKVERNESEPLHENLSEKAHGTVEHSMQPVKEVSHEKPRDPVQQQAPVFHGEHEEAEMEKKIDDALQMVERIKEIPKG